MTTALDFSEDYTDASSGIGAFSHALAADPAPSGYAGPRDVYAFLPTVAKAGDRTARRLPTAPVNTEVLGWIVARDRGQAARRRAFRAACGSRSGWSSDAD